MWHYHIKDVAGTLYKIKEKKNVCEARIVQLLTVSGNMQRWLVHLCYICMCLITFLVLFGTSDMKSHSHINNR